jgi:hypothetical protein
MRIERLKQISMSELRFRCLERARTGTEAIAFLCRTPRWQPGRLSSKLADASPDLRRARQALKSADWLRAHEALRAHFISRDPRFVIDPNRRDVLAASVVQQFGGAADDARQRANRLVEGRYDVLAYSDVSWTNRAGVVDWHLDPVHDRHTPLSFWARVPFLDPQFGDHKIVWELNRHQHWLALGRAAWLTGDPRYAAAFRRELASWLRANPPLTGGNWSSMLELGFRSVSWLWALHFFLPFEGEAESPWLVELLLGLDRQLDHVSRHLSVYFSPNTHLLGEALALYVAGRVLPELRSAIRWEAIGRSILLQQSSAQIHRDGGHAELSPHYHRYVLDFYLLALAIARRTHDPAAGPFAEVASRLATFCRAMADKAGRLPTIGDDDGGLLFPLCRRPAADVGDSLSLAAALLDRPDLAIGPPGEEVLWMLGGDRTALPTAEPGGEPQSLLFPDSGYAVLRSAAGHAVFDAGQHGFLNGGHAHADALSLVLSVYGRPLLIDPGTASYTTDTRVRDRFRSTQMHNTVAIDGRSQSVPSGPFHWQSTANAQVGRWRSQAQFDFIEAEHDGYLPMIHRRTVLRGPDELWLVADHVLGTERHRIDAHWHLDPSWAPTEISTHVVRLSHPDGIWANVASTAGELTRFHADAHGLGWCAPVYGSVVPSLTLRFSEEAQLPVSSITALGAARRPIGLAIETSPVRTAREDMWHRVGAVAAYGDSRFVALFATERGPLPALSGTLVRRQVQEVTGWGGRFRTDARAALLQLSSAGEPLSLVLIDATTASWNGGVEFTVGPLASATDLHLDRTSLEKLSHYLERTTLSAGRTICAE